MNDNTAVDGPADAALAACREADLLQQIRQLREGLWACYAIAGGDPATYDGEALDSGELASLVVDCVRDLRGCFDAARRDLR